MPVNYSRNADFELDEDLTLQLKRGAHVIVETRGLQAHGALAFGERMRGLHLRWKRDPHVLELKHDLPFLAQDMRSSSEIGMRPSRLTMNARSASVWCWPEGLSL